jgi:hypothetical protein
MSKGDGVSRLHKDVRVKPLVIDLENDWHVIGDLNGPAIPHCGPFGLKRVVEERAFVQNVLVNIESHVAAHADFYDFTANAVTVVSDLK